MNLKFNEEIGLVYDTIYWHSFTFNRETYEQFFSKNRTDNENYDEFYNKFALNYSPDIKLYPFFYCDECNNSVLADFFTENIKLDSTLNNLLECLSSEAFEQFTLKKLMRIQSIHKQYITYDEFRSYIYDSSFSLEMKFGCLNLIIAFDEMLELLKESLLYVYEHTKAFRLQNESIISKAYKENSSSEMISRHAKTYCYNTAVLKKLHLSISLFNKYLSFIYPKKGCMILGVNICNHIFSRDNNKCVPLLNLKTSYRDPIKKALIQMAINCDEFTVKDLPERSIFTEQSLKNKAMELVDMLIFTTCLRGKKRFFSLNKDNFSPSKQFEQFLDVLSTPARQDIFFKAASKNEFTVTDISNETDYSLTYVSKIVGELFAGGLLVIKHQENKKRYYSINKVRIETVKKSAESFFETLLAPNKNHDYIKLAKLLADPNFDNNII